MRNSFFEELECLVKFGLKNIEISWSNNKNWLDLLFDIKTKYPRVNLGSASIVNKQSIEDSFSEYLKIESFFLLINLKIIFTQIPL